MGGHVTTCQYASVHLRVKGLHATVENLREASDLADADSVYSAVFQQFLCAASSHDLPSEGDESLHERHESRLVADAD